MKIKPTTLISVDNNDNHYEQQYDGQKDARTIIAWLSSLDDYFEGE